MEREIIQSCPWCESEKYSGWGASTRGFEAVECSDCHLIYIKNRFTLQALEKFYENYLNDIHQNDTKLNEQRSIMYGIEFNLIQKYIHSGSVLDVGCSNGLFLDRFNAHGYECSGVEFGGAAAAEAEKKHPVWKGEFPSIDITKKFDLVVFRGVIEHVSNPKAYLEKAIACLKENGFIYITSTPNRDSRAADVFQDQWNQHIPEEHIMHFSPTHFKTFFQDRGFEIRAEEYFYEETPYANVIEDQRCLDAAVLIKNKGEIINFKSPPYPGTMMSLIFQKSCTNKNRDTMH